MRNEDLKTGKGPAIALILLIAAFGALRAASALNDLYIDEIWSLHFASRASYPLVLYSSEARGYAPAILFALLSFALAERWLKTRSFIILPFYWAAVALGLLAHSSFFYVLLALAGWSIAERLKSGMDNRAIRDVIIFNAVPFAAFAAVYVFFISGITIGGGTEGDILGSALSASAKAFGVPGGGRVSGIIGAIVALFFFAGGVSLESRQGSRRWVFFALCIVAAPALTIAVTKPEFFYFRYFLISFPFLYMLASFVLAKAFRASSAGKAFYGACVVLFLISNLYADLRLATVGRGAYFDAMMYMAEKTTGDEASVGSDHDFRNKAVLSFYARFLPGVKRLQYLDRDEWPENGPDWLILHSVQAGYKPYERTFEAGVEYSLQSSYGFSGDSGFSWHIYRKAGE